MVPGPIHIYLYGYLCSYVNIPKFFFPPYVSSQDSLHTVIEGGGVRKAG